MNYTPLPTHAPLKEYETDVAAYLAGLDERHLKLHEIAVKTLGSSYFVERTHGFLAYMKGRK
jgi:hypothetical protein